MEPNLEQDQEDQQKKNGMPEEDIERNKTIAGLAYFIFFLPLIVTPESELGKFHANQGILLLILFLVGNVVLGVIPVLGRILTFLFRILILVLGVLGLMNGFGGKFKELPLIGKFTIIK